MYYVKKPIKIRAVQIISTNYIDEWVWPYFKMGDIVRDGEKFIVKTSFGEVTAKEGDYIIQGVDGEIYPCGKDIFERTYIPCNDEELFEEI